MSGPDDIPGRHVPPRAGAIRPDVPGSGSTQDDKTGSDPSAADKADPAKRGDGERADAGLNNVRGGYGGPAKTDHDDDPSMVPNRPATDAQ